MLQWYGWLRRDRRYKWRQVCGPCLTLEDCSRLLSVKAKEEEIEDKNAVMTTGAEPTEIVSGRRDWWRRRLV